MTKGEMAVYVTQWLCGQLSRERILVHGEMCARCEKYGADACAKCWTEAAWRAGFAEAKRREEASR